jgi:hypothetical protein
MVERDGNFAFALALLIAADAGGKAGWQMGGATVPCTEGGGREVVARVASATHLPHRGLCCNAAAAAGRQRVGAVRCPPGVQSGE